MKEGHYTVTFQTILRKIIGTNNNHQNLFTEFPIEFTVIVEYDYLMTTDDFITKAVKTANQDPYLNMRQHINTSNVSGLWIKDIKRL